MPTPHRLFGQETVHERSLRNGGFITGPNHPLTRRLEIEKRAKAVQKPPKVLKSKDIFDAKA